MHRSTTSGVAKGLHLAGWPMSPNESTMLPSGPTNQWGHWEDRELVALNDRILNKLGAAWNDPPSLEVVISRKDEFLPMAVNYVRSRISAHAGGQWGIKDPRLVPLWPIWKAAFDTFHDIDLITVTPRRNEVAIAESLHKRDRMEISTATRLARTYHGNLDSLAVMNLLP